jgi:hypothetical protein
MKLPLKRSSVAAMPNWHPNFRNVALLPDLKVVRTSFVVNAVCITLASVALLFTAYRQYLALNISSDIRQSENRIKANAARNSKLLELGADFEAGTAKIETVGEFIKSPFRTSELLRALGASVPSYMDFTAVSYDGRNLSLHGTIRGASDTATALLTSYADGLRQNEFIGPIFPDINVTSVLRDPRTQTMTFEIQLKPPAPPPAPAKPKPRRT